VQQAPPARKPEPPRPAPPPVQPPVVATVVEEVPPQPVELPPGSWSAPPIRTGPLAEAVTAIPPLPVHDATAAGKRRNRWIMVGILAGCLLIVAVAGISVWSMVVNAENNRANLARKDYDAGLFAKSEDSYRKLLEKFPDSGRADEYLFMADLCEVRRLGQQLGGSDFRQDMTKIAAFLRKHKGNPLMQEHPHEVGETYVKLVRDMIKDVGPQPGQAVGSYMDAAKETLDVMTGDLAAAVSLADRNDIDHQFQDIRARFKVAEKRRSEIELIKQQPPTIPGIRNAEEIIKAHNLQEDQEARALLDQLYQKNPESVRWDESSLAPDAAARDEDTEPTLLVGPLLAGTPPRVVPEDGTVLALVRGVLYALRQSDGAILWFMRVGIDTTTLPVRIPPSPWNPELFLVQSADSRTLTALDARGSIMWTCPLSAPALGRPVVVKNRAYIATFDGQVHEIELAQGIFRGRFVLGEGIKLSVGGVHEPNTNLVYFPADEWCVFVLDVENHKCAKVMYTKHPSGSLRGEPIIASWTEREGGQKTQQGFLFLTLADELDSMQLRAYALPVENPRAERIPMNPDPRMDGWAWFSPHQDAEKIVIISDEGQLGLYGVRQKRTEDNPLFTLAPLDVTKKGAAVSLPGHKRNFLGSSIRDKGEPSAPDGPVDKAKWRGRSLVAYAAEEDNFWVLTYGKLQRLSLLLTAQGPQLLKAWKSPGTPVELGSALHASQVFDFRYEQGAPPATTLMLVTQPLNRQMCVATAVDAETGTIRWQRQLGIVSRGEPMPFGGGVLALDQSGGAFWFDPQKLGDKEQAGRGQKLGDALDDGETPPLLLAGLDGQSAYEFAIPTPAPGAKWELVVRRFLTNGGLLPTVAENRIPLEGPAHIAGSLSINPSGILVPLSNGEVMRVGLDGKQVSEGPPWRPSWEDASLRSFTTWTSESDLLTTNGRNGLLRWDWTPGKNEWKTVPERKEDETTLDMPSRIVTAPLALPAEKGGLRVLVACADRTLYLVDGPDQATAFKTKEGLRITKERKWTLPGEITAGPFTIGKDIYVIVERNRLFRIDLANPVLGPEFKCEGEALVGQPQMIEGMIVVADQSGRFVGLDPATLKPYGKGYKLLASVGPAASPVAFGPDLAFAPLTDGTVLLLSLAQLRQP
jgi:hypothetical protein